MPDVKVKNLDDEPKLPARPDDLHTFTFQKEGEGVVLLLGGRTYKVSEAQARKVQRDLNRIFGKEE